MTQAPSAETPEIICKKCKQPIADGETGLRHYGWYTAHSEVRCIELLETRLRAAERKADDLGDVLRRNGFVRCDIPACNCHSWHPRYGLPERMREIREVLAEAGVLNNETGNLPLRAIELLIAQLAALQQASEGRERDAERYKWLRVQMIGKRPDEDGLATEGQTPEGFDAAIDLAIAASAEEVNRG